MRLALPGSALVHAGALGLLLVGFTWPEHGDAPAPSSVSVLVVPVTTVSTNTAEAVVSDSTVSAISAGSVASSVVPVETPVLEPLAEQTRPVPPESVEPLEAVEVAAQDASENVAAEPVETVDLAELTSTAPQALEIEALQPRRADTTPVVPSEPPIEAVAATELPSAPVPQMASIQRQSAPIVHAPRRPEPAQQTPAAAGNGGRDSGDAVAATAPAAPRASGEGAGGSADVARYPGQIVSKLRAALRRAGGQKGEVVVRFTVLANGSVSGLGIARSSGSGAVDDAGLAIVRRAAPFPPIPASAGRGDWTFDVPLAFGG